VLKLGALDGTKIHANASRHSAQSYEHPGKFEAQLQAEMADLMAHAEAADRADVPDRMSISEELDPVIAMGREAHHPSLGERFAGPPPPPHDSTPLEVMDHRLKTPEGKQRHALPKQTPEPVFMIGLDTAKSVSQVHGVNETGKVAIRRKLRGQLGLFVEVLNDAAGELLFRTEVVQDQLAVRAYRLGDVLHRLDARAHDLTAPLVKELASPARRFILPALAEILLQQIGPYGPQVVAQQIAQACQRRRESADRQRGASACGLSA
jgi:hypothetical protein